MLPSLGVIRLRRHGQFTTNRLPRFLALAAAVTVRSLRVTVLRVMLPGSSLPIARVQLFALTFKRALAAVATTAVAQSIPTWPISATDA